MIIGEGQYIESSNSDLKTTLVTL